VNYTVAITYERRTPSKTYFDWRRCSWR